MWFTLTLALALAAPEGDSLARHMAASDQAAKAELDHDFQGAVDACQAAIAALSTGPRAERCTRRIAWFDARRDTDGGFDLWARLDAVRRLTWSADPDGARREVAAVRDDTQATPLLRAEAGLWLAHDALTRRQDAALALTDTSQLYDTRAALDDAHRRDVVLAHAQALVQAGRPEEAKAVEKEALVAGGSIATPVDQTLLRQHHDRVRTASWAALAVFAVASILAGGRRAPTPRPWALLPMGVALLGAYVIATSWDAGTGDAVLWMSGPLVGIHLLTARAQQVTERGAVRVAVGVLSAVASVAAAWLAFDFTGTLNQVWW